MSSDQPTNGSRRSESRLTSFEKAPETGTFRNLRFLTDSRKVNQPKTTLVVLGIVTLMALAIGWLLISRMEVKPRKSSKGGRTGMEAGKPASFFLSCSLDQPDAAALAAGDKGDIYVAYGQTLVRQRLVQERNQVRVEPVWSREFDAPITALYYASDPKSLLLGRLLIGFADKIILIDPEQAEGDAPLFASLDADSRLTSLAVGKEFVFAADIGKKAVHRFTALGEKQRDAGQNPPKNEENRDDLEDGPTFPGFEVGTFPYFDLAYAPRTGTLYVANPGKFRIEAFDGESGRWLSERSIEKLPGTEEGFSGDANPAGLHVLPSDTLLTVETGKTPLIRNLLTDGRQRAEINDPAMIIQTEGQKIVLAATGKSEGKNHLLLLTPEGQLGIFPEPVSENRPDRH